MKLEEEGGWTRRWRGRRWRGGDRLRRIRVIGEVVFSPSIEKRCLGFRGREKLVRQFYRGEELLPFEIPETVFGLASREGGEGSSFSSVLVLPSFQPPRGELTCPGGGKRGEEEEEVRFCRCTPTDSRTTFIACRIYGVFALATETRGKYKFVPRSAEISRLGRDLFLATIFSLPSFLLELTIGLIFLVHGVFTHSRFTVV